MFEKIIVTYKGKKYGYWIQDGRVTGHIRSEDNPRKTPYLKEKSALHSKVITFIHTGII